MPEGAALMRAHASAFNAKIRRAVDDANYDKAVRSLLSFQAHMWRNNLSGDAAIASQYNQAENYVLEKLGEL